MERKIDFIFGRTRLIIWRQGEWGFFARVERRDDSSIYLDVEFTHRETASLVTLRQFPLDTEGFSLEMSRSDGSEENVNFTLTSDEENKAAVTIEFDEGVQFKTLVS